MSNFIDVDVNQAQINELRAILHDERRLTQITRMALNSVARKSATAIRRQIAQEIGVGVRALGSSSGKNARGMVRPLLASDTRLSSGVRILNWNIPLIKTRMTPNKGEELPIGKEGPPVRLTNAPFKQTMHSGHVGWYVRDPDNEKRTMTDGTYMGRKRVPIKQVFSRSPRQVFENGNGSQVAEAGRMLETELSRQIDRYLSRKG